MKGFVIYTALTGGYDRLMQPASIRDDCDYICFTSDSRTDNEGVWRFRPIPFTGSDPARVSRFPKLNPHLVLPEYGASLYVDANVRITRELDIALDNAIEKETTCAMVAHPSRSSTYEEGLYVLRHSMGEPFKVYRQMVKLAQAGFHDSSGLFVCSIIFRRHLDPQVIEFSKVWWRGFQAGAKRDQLAVMPALEEAALQPEILIATDYVRTNTVPHSVKNHHSILWHGCHCVARTALVPLLRFTLKSLLADRRKMP